jgi:hypothetical protein
MRLRFFRWDLPGGQAGPETVAELGRPAISLPIDLSSLGHSGGHATNSKGRLKRRSPVSISKTKGRFGARPEEPASNLSVVTVGRNMAHSPIEKDESAFLAEAVFGRLERRTRPGGYSEASDFQSGLSAMFVLVEQA